MDNAVALVQAYLNVNGYFTVTEYPVVEAMKYAGFRTATDLDILAFRFPGAGRLAELGGEKRPPEVAILAPDAALGGLTEKADMIIGEVKEGRAELNQGAKDPAVLRAALTRFGCCSPKEISRVVDALLRHGRAETPCSHHIRLVAFGSIVERQAGQKYELISLGHVIKFLTAYIHEHWDMLRHTQFKDSTFGYLSLLEKARCGSPGG